MRKPFAILILCGIIAEFAVLIFFDKEVAAYGPIIFWAIGLYGMINYGVNVFKLSSTVKTTKPELFKKYSFGSMLTRQALTDKRFLSALDAEEQLIIEKNKTILKSVFFCIVLFALSAIGLVIK